jgi:ATP dependent DNA ligase C terminal region
MLGPSAEVTKTAAECVDEIAFKRPQVRREVYRRLKGLEIASCPFAHLPEKKRTMWALTRAEMENCKWFNPALVAQIEFAEWTRYGHLRHSKFVALRDDKDPRRQVINNAEHDTTNKRPTSKLGIDSYASPIGRVLLRDNRPPQPKNSLILVPKSFTFTL